MNKTRRSLYYPATYLTIAGLSLLVAPQFSLKLLLSNGDYGDVFPRVAGLMILGLGLIVIQVIRLRQEQLYSTLWAIRLLFCIGWLGLYFYTRDPYFLVLLAIVGVGFIWTGINLLQERKDKVM
jgi:uncharacterized membrane protein YqgA involved in biofilm formation